MMHTGAYCLGENLVLFSGRPVPNAVFKIYWKQVTHPMRVTRKMLQAILTHDDSGIWSTDTLGIYYGVRGGFQGTFEETELQYCDDSDDYAGVDFEEVKLRAKKQLLTEPPDVQRRRAQHLTPVPSDDDDDHAMDNDECMRRGLPGRMQHATMAGVR